VNRLFRMGPPCPVPGASIPEDSHLHWISFRGAGHDVDVTDLKLVLRAIKTGQCTSPD
jgi:hypothetical protein